MLMKRAESLFQAPPRPRRRIRCMAAGAPDPAKALARRVNLLELLGDAHPEVPEPPEEARTEWTPDQIKAYYERGGGERPADPTMAEDALEPDPLPPSTRPDGMYTCQRIGCDAVYDPRDPAATNPPGCCRYHPGAPLFHEGNKSWTCCGRKSHDFSLFMDIAGCATGRHTQRKPPKPATANVTARDSAGVKPTKLETRVDTKDPNISSSSASAKREDCNRCRSGFFCSDHAASAEAPAETVAETVVATGETSQPGQPSEPTSVDPHETQICRNVGCGEKFTEAENDDAACAFHPGPPIFHERKKGWACCDQTRWDFDEFLKIPTCAVGRHCANPANGGGFAKTRAK